MSKYGFLLIELNTEELPIEGLKKLGEDFVFFFLNEFKKKFFFCSSWNYYVTSRKISCIFENFSFYQKISKDKKIIYGPKININSKVNFFQDPLLSWINKFNINYKKINYFIVNKKKIFFVENEIKKKNIIFFINIIFKSVLLKLIKNRKVIRWGKNNFIFIRPVNNVIVMFNDKILNVNIFNIKSNNFLYGHRFLKKKKIILNHASKYEEFLFKYGKIIVNYNKRKNKIISILNNISLKKYFSFNYNNNFLNKITSMIEWPGFLICKFKKKFLSLPKELLVFIIEKHYGFSVFDINYNLLNYFIVITNSEFNDLKSKNIKKNYEFVIESELNDAKLLFINDIKLPFISYLLKLKNIVFYNKLGNFFDKIKRMLYLSKKISKYLFYKSIDLNLIYHAILLIKCDLATSLYKEYTDLKGIIGMYYSFLEYKNWKLSLIIKNHYFPRYSGDYIPKDKYSSVISLIDKLDTLVGILALNNFINLNRNNDPYGLRKLSLLILNIILVNNFHLNLYNLLKFNVSLFNIKFNKVKIIYVINFIFKRSNKIFLDFGYSKKFINSVKNLNIFDFLDIKLRLELVWKIRNSKKFLLFLNLIKRIRNILLRNKYMINCFSVNNNFLILKEEKILFNYIFFLEKKIFFCFKKYMYNDLMNYFFMSINKVENFFSYVRIDIDDVNIKNNRLILLNKLNSIFLRFINFNNLI